MYPGIITEKTKKEVSVIRNIPIKIHSSLWLFALGYCGTSWWFYGLETALIDLAFVSVLWLSVLAHELAHSMAAAFYGCRTKQIVLFILGGGAEIEDLQYLTPGATCSVSVAGPLMSLWVSLLLISVSGWTYVSDLGLIGFIRNMAAINFVLALFNLIPAFPMDGGRILHAIVYSFGGKDLADTSSKVFTCILVAVGIGYSIYTLNVLLALICTFIAMSVSKAVESLNYGRRFR